MLKVIQRTFRNRGKRRGIRILAQKRGEEKS